MAETVADRMRMLRGADSQDAFSALLGVSKDTVGKYERGKILPGAEVLTALREKRGVDLNWLLTGESEAAAAADATDPLDLALMEMVVSTVADRLGQHRIQLKPDRLGQLCAAVYRIVDRERRLNPAAGGHFDRDAASSVVDAVSSLIA